MTRGADEFPSHIRRLHSPSPEPLLGPVESSGSCFRGILLLCKLLLMLYFWLLISMIPFTFHLSEIVSENSHLLKRAPTPTPFLSL